MKVIITGGLGFIGSNLIKFLLQKKDIKKIIIIDKQSIKKSSYINKICKFKYFANASSYKSSKFRVDVVRSNVYNYSDALLVCRNTDYIVHLAAESGIDVSVNEPYKSFKTNILGAFNYLDAARIGNVKGFIFASSSAVFGDTKPPYREDLNRKPISPYGSSKLAIESYCETYSQSFGLNTTILRFSNAYGPYSQHKNSVISKFIKNIFKNRELEIYGDGNQTRDFIYVDEICSAIYLSIKKSLDCKIYHVSTGKETSMKILLSELSKLFDKEISNIVYKKPRVGDMKKSYSKSNKISKDLKWRHSVTLTKGLKKTLNWYKKI